jgi:hypothetical protein
MKGARTLDPPFAPEGRLGAELTKRTSNPDVSPGRDGEALEATGSLASRFQFLRN